MRSRAKSKAFVNCTPLEAFNSVGVQLPRSPVIDADMRLSIAIPIPNDWSVPSTSPRDAFIHGTTVKGTIVIHIKYPGPITEDANIGFAITIPISNDWQITGSAKSGIGLTIIVGIKLPVPIAEGANVGLPITIPVSNNCKITLATKRQTSIPSGTSLKFLAAITIQIPGTLTKYSDLLFTPFDPDSNNRLVSRQAKSKAGVHSTPLPFPTPILVVEPVSIAKCPDRQRS